MYEINSVKLAIIQLCRDSRKRRGYTLKQVDSMTGIHYSSLSEFENGNFNFDKAHAYYFNIMDAGERASFQRLIDDLKESYLYDNMGAIK